MAENEEQHGIAEPAERGAAANAARSSSAFSTAEHSGGEEGHAASECCAPGRSSFPAALPTRDDQPVPLQNTGSRHRIEQAMIPAQVFAMGDSSGDENRGDGETPVHEVSLEAFSIDTTPVTNADFLRFTEATGYRTEAEEWGFSAVFHLATAAPHEDIMGVPPGTPWWRGVRGADWRHPGGRRSDINALADHPAVHISWNDAVAYCAWANRSLPTEAQWEAASRGGLSRARFPWGDDPHGAPSAVMPSTFARSAATPSKQSRPSAKPRVGEPWRMNIWQGTFPTANTLADGFLTTAPVRTFEPNAYGLWQTIGNVWEWCADWWSPTYYRTSQREEPRGPAQGQVRVMRGGSYLCHDSYCNRYRNAARSSNTPDSSMGNAGFRTVERRADGDTSGAEKP